MEKNAFSHKNCCHNLHLAQRVCLKTSKSSAYLLVNRFFQLAPCPKAKMEKGLGCRYGLFATLEYKVLQRRNFAKKCIKRLITAASFTLPLAVQKIYFTTIERLNATSQSAKHPAFFMKHLVCIHMKS